MYTVKVVAKSNDDISWGFEPTVIYIFVSKTGDNMMRMAFSWNDVATSPIRRLYRRWIVSSQQEDRS